MISEVILITLGSFIAAVINAAVATGGVFILLVVTTSVLPLSIAIPLQPALIFSSLFSRIWLLRALIDRRITLGFMFGTAIGVAVASQVFINLEEKVIAISMGIILLLLTWLPQLRLPEKLSDPFFYIGAVHSFLSTLFAVGSLLQPMILKTSLDKRAITATLAACLCSMEVMKLLGYLSGGFDYSNYFYHIVLATIAGFIGTRVGRSWQNRISEQMFRTVFRWLITAFAVEKLLQGLFWL